MVRSVPVLLLLASLPGCTLIDQRTFNPSAGTVRTAARPPAAPGPQALIVIDYAQPTPVYEDTLRQAVEQALARKADAAFDVVTVVPATGTPESQVAAATALTPDARAVARAINTAGVDDDHILLSARTAAGMASRQIQVFVR